MRSVWLGILLCVVGLAQVAKTPADELLNQAMAEMQAGNPVQAEFWYREMRAGYPRDTRWVMGLVSALDVQNKTAEALKVARETQPMFGKSATISLMIGQLLAKLDRVPEAMAEYQVALRDSTSQAMTATVYAWIGSGYQQLEQIDEAIAAHRKSKELSGRASFPLAWLLGGKGDYEGEVREYRAVLRENPDHPSALNNLAYAWAVRGENLDEALAFSRHAVALQPRISVMEDTLGWVYFKRGMLEDAESTMVGALLYEGGNQGTLLEHLAAVMDARGEWTAERRELRKLLDGEGSAGEVARMKVLLGKMRGR